MSQHPPLEGKKILVTGPTGQVAFPLTRSLAADNDVWGIARFGDSAGRERVAHERSAWPHLDLVGRHAGLAQHVVEAAEERRRVAEKFVQAGNVVVGYSLESGNDEILKIVNWKIMYL